VGESFSPVVRAVDIDTAGRSRTITIYRDAQERKEVREHLSAGSVERDVPTSRARRVAAFTALWRAISHGRRPGTPGLGERARAVPRMVGDALAGRYAALGRGRLALLGFALAYLVSPIDLVPEAFVPLLGLADDGVVAFWLAGAFLVETDRFLAWERARPAVQNQAH
jgi:uncharacterized membrane protein YkvA (DUF1232 family)